MILLSLYFSQGGNTNKIYPNDSDYPFGNHQSMTKKNLCAYGFISMLLVKTKAKTKAILFEVHLSINETLKCPLRQIQNSQNSLTFNIYVITQMYFGYHYHIIGVFPSFILLCSSIRQTSRKQLNLYRNRNRMEFIGYSPKYRDLWGEMYVTKTVA